MGTRRRRGLVCRTECLRPDRVARICECRAVPSRFWLLRCPPGRVRRTSIAASPKPASRRAVVDSRPVVRKKWCEMGMVLTRCRRGEALSTTRRRRTIFSQSALRHGLMRSRSRGNALARQPCIVAFGSPRVTTPLAAREQFGFSARHLVISSRKSRAAFAASQSPDCRIRALNEPFRCPNTRPRSSRQCGPINGRSCALLDAMTVMSCAMTLSLCRFTKSMTDASSQRHSAQSPRADERRTPSTSRDRCCRFRAPPRPGPALRAVKTRWGAANEL